MAVEIGALRAMLSLDSAAFEKGAKRAQTSMNGLQRSLSKTAAKMKSIGKRMSASITAPMAAGVGLLMRSSLQSAAEIQRMAGVANAGTTEFQKFAAGAKTVGIEQDKLADILKDVNDRVGDFITTGGGEMKDFFEKIGPKVGVTAAQFAKLSGPEALQLYVSSLEKAGASQQEMTFYLESMASDATLLLPLLRNNGSEMGRLGDRAKELGAIMDEKTIASLNRSNSALRDLGRAGSALSNQLTAALAPAFEALVETMTSVAQWFSDLSPKMQKMVGIAAAVAAAIGPLAIALGFMASGLAAIASPIGLVVIGLAALAGAAAYVVMNWDSLKERFPILATAAKRLGDAWVVLKEGVVENFNNIKTTVTNVIDGIRALFSGDIKGALTHFGDAWTSLGQTIIDGVSNSLDMLRALFPDFMAAGERIVKKIGAGIRNFISNVGSAIDQLVTDLIAWIKAIPGRIAEAAKEAGAGIINAIKGGITGNAAAVKKEIQSQGESLGTDLGAGLGLGLNNSLPALKSDIEGYLEEAEAAARDKAETHSPSKVWMRIGEDLMGGLSVGISDKAQAAAQAAAAAAGTVTAAADQTLKTGTDKLSQHFDSIGDAMAGAIVQGKSMGEALGRVFQQIAQDLIASGISRMIKSLFGGAGGGGGIGSAIASIFGGFRAAGGPVSAGRAYMVGEKGPEMIVPKSSGTVIPNHNLGMGGGKLEIVVVGEEGPLFKPRVAQITGPIVAGASRAQTRAHGAQSQRFNQRGTMT